MDAQALNGFLTRQKESSWGLRRSKRTRTKTSVEFQYPHEFYDWLNELGLLVPGSVWLNFGCGLDQDDQVLQRRGVEVDSVVDVSMVVDEEGDWPNHVYDVVRVDSYWPYVSESMGEVNAYCLLQRLLKPNGLLLASFLLWTDQGPIVSETQNLIFDYNFDWFQDGINDDFNHYYSWSEAPRDRCYLRKDFRYQQMKVTYSLDSWLEMVSRHPAVQITKNLTVERQTEFMTKLRQKLTPLFAGRYHKLEHVSWVYVMKVL